VKIKGRVAWYKKAMSTREEKKGKSDGDLSIIITKKRVRGP